MTWARHDCLSPERVSLESGGSAWWEGGPVNGIAITRSGQLQKALEAGNGHWDLVIDRAGQRLSLSVSG